jgi:hypothetical protein
MQIWLNFLSDGASLVSGLPKSLCSLRVVLRHTFQRYSNKQWDAPSSIGSVAAHGESVLTQFKAAQISTCRLCACVIVWSGPSPTIPGSLSKCRVVHIGTRGRAEFAPIDVKVESEVS